MRSLTRRSLGLIATWCMLVIPLSTYGADGQPASGSPLPSRPNIVVILADDMGFSDLGCYGGEISTPNLDRLAAGGLRMTDMYNTGRCWPTRACLLTGYYAQQVNRDPMGPRPRWAALLPQLLKPAGYRSYHSGKWHVDGKVLAGGFERSYCLEDHDRYYTPKRHSLDDTPLSPATPADNYYATTAIAGHAIDFLAEHAAKHKDDPFLLYLAFTAPHFPLHATAEFIAPYWNTYMPGWDAAREQRMQRMRDMGIVDGELSQRDANFTPRYLKPDVMTILGPGEADHAVAWTELTPDQQRFQATKMALHAGMITKMDREIGRVLAQLRAMNAMDNTLIVFLSDNGADATLLVRGDGHMSDAPPGTAETYMCLGPGWATASNTPFRRHKIWVHEGGISTPCILHWPAAIKSGGALRRTPAHVIDLVPTFLELAGLKAPDHRNDLDRPELPGKSLVPAIANDVRIPRDYLYWEHEGNAAIRVNDWKLVCESERGGTWELYDLKKDRIESRDLAKEQPERVKAMSVMWQRLADEFRAQGNAKKPRKPTSTKAP